MRGKTILSSQRNITPGGVQKANSSRRVEYLEKAFVWSFRQVYGIPLYDKVVQYEYDALNRLTSVTDWIGRTTTYIYDAASRLTGTVNPNATTAAYTYDAAGNRLTLLSTSSDTTPPTTPLITDDGLYTTSLTQLKALWASNDPESGILEYQYAIGTTPQGTDVAGWTSTGINNW